ncbi:MAG TPA: O-antigen ligase family protein [Gaiellaceae bacterium]|nr:O-antigen ligase family protein [Gaiellaceae bacterium]
MKADARSRAADLLALVPAAALPLVFLHRRYQAHTAFGPVDVFGSDVAVLVTVLVAAVAGVWFGWRPLRRPLALWCVAGALLALLGLSCLWRPIERPTTHLVTFAKVVEYALLAPALVLLLRRPRQVDRFLVAFVAWSVAASGWGLLQFVGAVGEFEGKRPGQREVSFLGIHDFAAFSGATLAIGLAAVALAERRRLAGAAVGAGAVGAILAASVFALAGIVLAAVAALAVGRRVGTLTRARAGAVAAVVAVVAAGTLALRSYDIANFFSFLGIRTTTAAAAEDVQTGSQRAMLAYIGLRIWEDHPLLGVGFERSADRYEPYLAAAKRKFPDQPAQAYPSPAHPWGVQNLWVQLLADAGVAGFALGAATFLAALALALRAPPPAVFLGLVAAGFVLVAAGTWNAVGIVAGVPLQAVTWLGFGLAAALRGLE